IQQLQTQQQQTQADMAGRQQAIALLTQSLEQAQQAAKICVTVRPAYETYQAAETALQTLAREQTERQNRQKSQQKLRKTLDQRAADITRLKVQLDGFEAATAEIAQLQPQVQQQTELEAQLQALQQAQTTLAQVRGEHQATAKQQTRQAQQVTKTGQEIDRLQALEQTVAAASDLAPQRDRLQQQLSRLEAARQFETELQRLVSQGRETSDRTQAQVAEALQALAQLSPTQPPESATIAAIQQALETGVAVHQNMLGSVQQILDDLSAQTDAEALRSQLQACQTRLAELAKYQNQVAVLPERRQQLTQLQTEQATLMERLEHLQQQLDEGKALRDRLRAVQAALQALEDPKGRCAVLTRSQRQQPTVQKRYDEMQAAQAGIQQQIDDLEQQLHAFETLDTDIATQTQAKQIHQAGYQQYLQYERAAQDETRLIQELTTARQAIAELEAAATQLQTALAQAQSNFDPQTAQQVAQTYQTVRSERDRLAGSLPQQQQLLAELQRQIADLKALAAQRDTAIEERQQRDRIKRFVNFARKAYKEAGPRITERYVQQISREGDRLFRELLNRPNVALTWTRDYEILVQEGPNTRRFVNLSGGEQMCAALAVRLALLKVLADIDIAFFDEPTTNMDRPRRESLAEAIARIRSFKQLFVISHDDSVIV
ncbi:MAG: SMC family ATPase, partial [Cyanobacteria bacterium J06607_6]